VLTVVHVLTATRWAEVSDVIEVRNVWYTYPGEHKPVLHEVNFSVKRGEVLGIMGPIGAGKTTLCLCLSGLIPHSIGGNLQGEVIVTGLKTVEHEASELNRKIGIVFQDPEIQIFGMEVEEDVGFKPKNMGMPDSEVSDRVRWALHYVRLDGFQRRFPYTLSGGQKQRLAIASILSARPEILVLDEPTSELDPIGKVEVFDVIRQLTKSESMTVVIVEHEAEELARIADRILVMKDGQVVRDASPRECFKDIEELEDLGVRAPEVLELGHLLMKDQSRKWTEYDYPLIVEEAQYRLEPLLKNLPKKSQNFEETVREYNKGEAVIEVQNLTHIYGAGTSEEVVALQGINLQVHKGEMVALIGQNGCGKTTLAKHLNGLLRPTEGTVRVLGLDTRRVRPEKLAEKVGYCFQNPDHQIFKSTVFEEVAFGPRNLLLSKEEIQARVQESLSTVGLIGYEKSNPFFLSKGDRQRVAVASVLAMHPEVFVIDEPTTGLDWRTSDNMMLLVKDLNAKGHTVLFITHNMRIVAQYARRVVVMHEGRVLLDGPTRSVFAQPDILGKTFINPPQITQLCHRLRNYIGSDRLTVREVYEELQRFH